MKTLVLLALVLATAALPRTQAAVLLAWDPQGLAGTWPENWSSTAQGGVVTVDSGVAVVSGLSRGAGTSLAGLNNGWGVGAMNQATRTAAETDGDYLFFALAPLAGNSLSLTSLDSNVRLPQAAWDAGSTRYIWQYKIGDGAYTDIGSPLALSGAYNTNGAAQPSLDLSGIAALQNITDTVEFRLYAWGTGGQFVFGRLTGNDLALSGSVAAVPEPSRLLLLPLGGLLLLSRRVRHPV